MNKPPDNPQINIGGNASRPGLVVFGIGTGTDPLNITPEKAETIAAMLLGAAAAVRQTG